MLIKPLRGEIRMRRNTFLFGSKRIIKTIFLISSSLFVGIAYPGPRGFSLLEAPNARTSGDAKPNAREPLGSPHRSFATSRVRKPLGPGYVSLGEYPELSILHSTLCLFLNFLYPVSEIR